MAASASADALPPAVGVKTAPGAPVGLQEVPLQPARATPSSLSSSFKRTEGFSIDPRKREEKAEKVVRVSSLGDKMNLPIVASGSPSAGGLAMRLKQKPLEGGSLTTVSRVPSADAAVPTPASVLVNANKPSPVPRTPEPILASPKRSQSPGVKVAQTSPVRPRSPAKPAADAGNTPERTLPNVAQGQTSSPSRPTDAPKSVLAGARSAVNAANPNAPLGKPSRSTTPELPRPTSSAKVDDRPLAGTPFQPTFSPKVPAALGAGAYRLSPAPGPEAGSIVRTVSPALSGSGGSYQDPSQLSSSAVSQTVVSSSPTTAMSRTQKKLMLQRQSVMASEPPQVTQRAPSRLARESERASKEYWNSTRRWADPMQESLDRVMAAIREERVKAGLPVEPEVEADDRTAASTTAVTSQASSTTSSTPQPPSPIARPSNQLQPSESTVNLQNRRLQSARDGMRRIQSAPGMAAAAGRTRSSGLWNMLFGN